MMRVVKEAIKEWERRRYARDNDPGAFNLVSVCPSVARFYIQSGKSLKPPGRYPEVARKGT